MRNWLRDERLPLGVIFLIALVANSFTPRIVDDFGQARGKYDGLPGILNWVGQRYQSWSGRLVADFNNALFLSIPKVFFNVANSLMFVLLVYLIYRYAFATGRAASRGARCLGVIFSCLLVFFCVPVFGQVILWESGSVNYLWNINLVLMCVLPLYLYACGCEDSNRTFLRRHTAAYMALSVIAGCTNENTVVGVLFLCVLLLVFAHKKYGQIEKVYVASTLLMLAGFIVLIAAPGNYVRRGVESAKTSFSAFRKVENAVAGVASLYIDPKALLVPFLLFLGLIAVVWVYKKRLSLPGLVFFLASFVMVLAYCATGLTPSFGRSMFGATIFLIIAVMLLVSEVLVDKPAVDICKVVCMVVLPAALMQSIYAFVGLVNLYHQERTIERYTCAQKGSGVRDIVIPEIERNFETKYSPLYGLEDISSKDKDHWTNHGFCYYYDVDSVIAIDRNEWKSTYGQGW